MGYENFVVIISIHKNDREKTIVIDSTRWRELLRVLKKRQKSLYHDFFNLTKMFLGKKDIEFWVDNGFFKEVFE